MTVERRGGVIHGLALLALLLSGCVYTPQLVTRYDEDCDIEFRQLALTIQQMQAINPGTSCSGKECLALLTAQILLVPASAIVSGSIVLVGNTVFWMQKEGRCLVDPPPSSADHPLP